MQSVASFFGFSLQNTWEEAQEPGAESEMFLNQCRNFYLNLLSFSDFFFISSSLMAPPGFTLPALRSEQRGGRVCVCVLGERYCTVQDNCD